MLAILALVAPAVLAGAAGTGSAETPAGYAVDAVDAPEEVRAGHAFTVGVEVTNHHESAGTARVVVSADDTELVAVERPLPPETTETLELGVLAPSEPGEYELAVETQHDTDSRTLVVAPAESDQRADDGGGAQDPDSGDEDAASGNDDGRSSSDASGLLGDALPGFGLGAALLGVAAAVALARGRAGW